MSYRLKRIDPYWFKHPVLPFVVLAGAALALFAGYKQMTALFAIGVVVSVGGLFLAMRPVITATFATLGILGGFVSVVVAPDVANAGLGVSDKAMMILFFTLSYAAITEGVLLLISVVYNFFVALSPGGALRFEFEEDGGEG